MKYLHTVLTVGLALPLFFLNAEDTLQLESPYTLTEEAPLSALDEEISFLEDEFETELVSLKDATQEPLLVEVPAPSVVESEITLEASEKEENSITSLVTENVIDSKELTSIGLEPSFNEEEPENSSLLVIEEPSARGEPAHFTSSGVTVDLKQAFSGAPIIYSVLIGMSIFSVCLWLYSLASMRLSTRVSPSLMREVQNHLNSNHFSEALDLCHKNNNLISKMLVTGIESRKYGLPMVMESMKAEAKRSTVLFWQKLSLLNDIAVIAPMLGLLGTVLGMFYAFYDVNRSIESISTLFDGLGVSVGTTVAGLLVAIVALILHSTAKYRLIRALAKVENQAQSMVTLLDDKTHIHKG